MRYKLIISDQVAPGPLWQVLVYLGSHAVVTGYGSINFDAWLMEQCPLEHQPEVLRSLQIDNTPYASDDPFKVRIYKVHPDTYAADPKMNHASVDLFQEHVITLKDGTQYSFDLPIPLKVPLKAAS